MTGALVLPGWAAAAFVGLLGLLIALARWSLSKQREHLDLRLDKLDDKVGKTTAAVHTMDNRLVRVETILNGGGTDPAAQRFRAMTPPTGVPTVGST